MDSNSPKGSQDGINGAKASADRLEPAGDQEESLKDRVIEVMKSVYDPEIPVNVYELGLVYNIDVDSNGAVVIRMTLTSPMCPVAGSLPPEVEHKVGAIPGVTSGRVELVWDPPWNPSMMSEAAKLQLNMF